MKQLNKTQLKARDEIATKLRDGRESLDEALEKYNDAVQKSWEDFALALESYNELVDTAKEWRNEIVGKIDDYVNDRSDKWHESDAAQAITGWKDDLDAADIERVEMDAPEEVELDVEDLADMLDQLPEEAS